MVESTLPPSASKDPVRSGWWYTWKTTFGSKTYHKIASPKAATQNESFTIVVVEVYVVEIILTHHPILVQTSKQNSSLASFSTETEKWRILYNTDDKLEATVKLMSR
jgi:hypothetical protein